MLLPKLIPKLKVLNSGDAVSLRGALLSFQAADFDTADIAFSHSVLDLEYLAEASGDELFRCVRSMVLLESCV